MRVVSSRFCICCAAFGVKSYQNTLFESIFGDICPRASKREKDPNVTCETLENKNILHACSRNFMLLQLCLLAAVTMCFIVALSHVLRHLRGQKLPKYGYCTHVWCILQRLQKVSKREKGPNVISETLESETFWMHLRRNNVMPWQLCLGA